MTEPSQLTTGIMGIDTLDPPPLGNVEPRKIELFTPLADELGRY